MNPLVSIIIPVYNAEKYLAACIDSAIAQTWQPTEVIIVDDGSTDGSFEIVGRYTKLPQIKLVTQQNKGASAARNAGLRAATGDYIQFLDADDLLSTDKIEAQINILNGSVTSLALCRTIHFNDEEDYRVKQSEEEWFYKDINDPVDFLIKLYAGDDIMPGYGGMVQPNSWLTPTKLIEKAGPWNEELSLDDDGEFFCRMILASDGIKFSKKGENYYRKFDNQLSLSAQKSKKGVESGILAIDLKYSYLKAKTEDGIIDRIFAKHYWWLGVLIYPEFKSLSKYCIKKAKKSNYNGEKYVGGRAGHILASFFGWKAARIMSHYQQLIKKLWA